tara:strand:- start:1005 stop:1220 length:216 start_codon:yes stop_codon:yes gene_type:complete
MKRSWIFWVLVVAIVIVIGLIIFSLLFGFGGEGSDIVDGNVAEDSLIGQGVGLIEDSLEGVGENGGSDYGN